MYRTEVFLSRLNDTLKNSPFLADIGLLKRLISDWSRDSGCRSLTSDEIADLERQGSRADDWHSVRVGDRFVSGRIYNSRFIGSCYLGVTAGRVPDTGAASSMEIIGSTVSSSWIMGGCRISGGSFLHRTLLCTGAEVTASTVAAEGSSCFGNGTVISPGLESGGREIAVCADLELALAEALCGMRDDGELQEAYRRFIAAYLSASTADFSIAAEGASVSRLLSGKNIFLGRGVRVENCPEVADVTVYGTAAGGSTVSGGAVVRQSIIRENCTVDSGALVEKCLHLSHSGAAAHARVAGSIIGHSSVIERGECLSSFVGPLTGMHHHGLLISAFWPRGKGNLGYGAMVGSNHTSRGPDQEIICGEGMFFGLGCSIKFPADYSKAAYSVVPTGMVLPPQKMEFPFSLIAPPDGAASPAGSPPRGLNRLRPGWVLYSNLYMCVRASYKYEDRKKGRGFDVPVEVFRRDTMIIVEEAFFRLESLLGRRAERNPGPETGGTMYPGDIDGLGKNYLTREDAQKGRDVYRFILEYYCLREYFRREEEKSGHESDPGETGYALSILERLELSGLPEKDLVELYRMRLDRFFTYAADARAKDSVRGGEIIPDYHLTHPAPEADPVLVRLEKWTASEKERAETGRKT